MSDIEEIERIDIRRNRGKWPFRIQFRMPTWLCSHVWDLSVEHAGFRRSMHFTTYNMVSDTSKVAAYCKRGNLSGLQRLFAKGEASPLDVIWDLGEFQTLLEVSRYGSRTCWVAFLPAVLQADLFFWGRWEPDFRLNVSKVGEFLLREDSDM
jgi:hypothetical protein